MPPANDNQEERTPFAGVLERVNRVRVTAELLGSVLRAQTRMLSQRRSPEEAAMLRLFQLLMNEGYRGGEVRMIATAVELRLTALANLIADDGVAACSVPREAHPAVITFEMLQAGADEPLVEGVDGQPPSTRTFPATRFPEHE